MVLKDKKFVITGLTPAQNEYLNRLADYKRYGSLSGVPSSLMDKISEGIIRFSLYNELTRVKIRCDYEID